jgi:FkbM family methyltransferase
MSSKTQTSETKPKESHQFGQISRLAGGIVALFVVLMWTAFAQRITPPDDSVDKSKQVYSQPPTQELIVTEPVRPYNVSEWFVPLKEQTGVEARIRVSAEAKPQADWVMSHEKAIFKEMLSVCHENCRNRGIFVDSGANDGLWSLIAAAYGCKVYAVEPQLRCLELLSAAHIENDLQVELVNAILSAEHFQVEVSTDECSGTTQYFSNGLTGDMWGKDDMHVPIADAKKKVFSTSLDHLIGPVGQVEMWHIDTEGAEIGVLKSALNLFTGRRIKRVIMEWTPEKWGEFGVSQEDGVKLAKFIFDSPDWDCICIQPRTSAPFDWSDRSPRCSDVYCTLV